MKRRDFIQKLLMGSGIGMLGSSGILEALIRSRLLTVYASDDSDFRSYFSVIFNGGVQWWYACPMNAKGEGIVSNPYVSTNFKNGQPLYETVALSSGGKTFHMPSVWGMSIPLAAGGSGSLANLLEHSGFMRGFVQPVDNHGINRLALQLPETTARSIPGIIADQAIKNSSPIPSIFGSYGDERAFRSSSASNLSINLSSSNLLESEVLKPFLPDGEIASILQKRDQFAVEYSNVLASLKQKGVDTNERIQNLFGTSQAFEDLIYRDFGDLASIWNSLYAKYNDLQMRCTDMSELFTESIPSATTPAEYRKINSANHQLINADLRTIIQPTTRLGNLSASLALAEYMISKGLCPSILVALGGVGGMRFEYSTGTTRTNETMIMDAHDIGVLPSMVGLSFAFRSLFAGLNELMNQLRSSGMGDRSIIHISSEFSRSPKADGSGSDHGTKAVTSMLLSDRIKSPFIAGNILRNLSSATYPGTWLYAAGNPNFENGTSTFAMGNHASSVCSALKVESPTPNFQSTIFETPSGGIQPVLGDGDIVDS